MKQFLLVINAGSATLKFSVYRFNIDSGLSLEVTGKIDGGESPMLSIKDVNGNSVFGRKLENMEASNPTNWIVYIQTWLLNYLANGKLLAIGHRIVHGGVKYSSPVMINNDVLLDLEALVPLAPLHQPHNLKPIHALLAAMPDVPQVACFDTAFHRSQPEVAQRYALPLRYFDEGVRHYGFHGLSYEYVSAKLMEIDASTLDNKIIVAHLGNGSSLCALHKGISVATTMGFSPLDGLMMGTRCGQIDPGVLLYLLQHDKLDATDLERLLYYESGLLGVSGISNDMRTLLASDNPSAQAAIDLYVYRATREIGSLAMTLGGFDSLVFTGGIGENSAEIRSQICKQMVWLGLEIDESLNAANSVHISTNNSNIGVYIINTDENLMIALHAQKLLGLY